MNDSATYTECLLGDNFCRGGQILRIFVKNQTIGILSGTDQKSVPRPSFRKNQSDRNSSPLQIIFSPLHIFWKKNCSYFFLLQWSIFWPQILFFPHPHRGSGTENPVFFPKFLWVRARSRGEAPKILGLFNVKYGEEIALFEEKIGKWGSKITILVTFPKFRVFFLDQQLFSSPYLQKPALFPPHRSESGWNIDQNSKKVFDSGLLWYQKGNCHVNEPLPCIVGVPPFTFSHNLTVIFFSVLLPHVIVGTPHHVWDRVRFKTVLVLHHSSVVFLQFRPLFALALLQFRFLLGSWKE